VPKDIHNNWIRDRLANTIRAELESHLTAVKLASEITRAANIPGFRFDRRKISNLAHGHDVTLTLDEIQAIDSYLVTRSSSLGKILERGTLLKHVTGNGRTVILVGARPSPVFYRETECAATHVDVDRQLLPDGASDSAYVDDKRYRFETDVVSEWDVRAQSFLQTAMHRVAPGSNIEHRVVLYRDPAQYELQCTGALEGTREWQKLFTELNAPSVVVIGSQQTNLAAELALCYMLGVEPFKGRSNLHSPPLPFVFVFWKERVERLPSNLALHGRNVEALLQRGLGTENACALYLNGELLLVQDASQASSWKEWGVLVVQRRSGGQVWLVVSGLTGPATYAVAQSAETF
jgi:hypothetical protein